MRRIYESEALDTDDEEPFKPRERGRKHEPQTFRSINSSAWSDRLLPVSVRRWAVSVDVSIPQTEFDRGDSIPFVVTMHNSLPMPVTIPTRSPLLWTWSVNDYPEASHLPLQEPADETGKMHFERGERKRFEKEWSGLFRIEEREWDYAEPGVYTISAEINTPESKQASLYDEATVEIV